MRRRAVRNRAQTVTLVLLAVLFIAPFYFMVTLSLKTPNETLRTPPTYWPHAPTFEAYRTLWGDGSFPRYLLNGLIYTGIGTAVVVFSSLLAGYAFARLQFRGREVLFYVVLASIMIPPEILLIPNFVIVAKLGWLNTFRGLLAPNLISAFGIFVVRQAIRTIPSSLFEAAAIDGANHRTLIRRVALPLIYPSVLTVAFLSAVRLWNDFAWPLIVSTDTNRRTPQVGLFTYAQQATTIPIGMAGATLVVVPVVLLFILMQRRIITSFVTAGPK